MRQRKEESANAYTSQEGYIHSLELQVETFALLASRLASLLHPSRDGGEGSMPSLRLDSRSSKGKAVANVEDSSGTSGNKSSTRKGKRSKATKSKVAQPTTEQKRRQSKAYKAQQKIYQARFYAKKKAEKAAVKAKGEAA